MSGTPNIDLIWRLAQLCEEGVPTTMFMTSTAWGQLASEVVKHQPDLLNLPTPVNFKELRVGKWFTVVNSGSEDQDSVDESNRQAAEQARFAFRRDTLITGKF